MAGVIYPHTYSGRALGVTNVERSDADERLRAMPRTGPRHARLLDETPGSSRPVPLHTTLPGGVSLASAAAQADTRPVPLHTTLPGGVSLASAAAQADTDKAFDELQEWINRAPGERVCAGINRLEGRWSVALGFGSEVFTAGRDAELRGAIRNALMIAKFAGCP